MLHARNAQRVFPWLAALGGDSIGTPIAHYKEHRAPAQHAGGLSNSAADVRAPTAWFKSQEITHNPQHMTRTLARRHNALHTVGEADKPHAIIRSNSTKRNGGSNLCRQFTLQLCMRSKRKRTTQINRQHDGELSLFAEQFDVRKAGARAHIPINGTNVVAVLVRSNFFEFHSASLESGTELASHHVTHEV